MKWAARLLPDAAARALGRWWETNASTYADGTPGAPTVRYAPGRWAQITPRPKALAPTSARGDAAVSRAEVAAAAGGAQGREGFREALVATYVWGKGKRGTRGTRGTRGASEPAILPRRSGRMFRRESKSLKLVKIQ